MTFPLVRAALNAEASDDIHMTRILLLVGAANHRKTTRTIKGITKLAKLDFLLRYPNCLKRALYAQNKDIGKLNVSFLAFESSTIESKMIRFRYGPWDARYRRWIGVLVAKGLIDTFVQGNTVCLEITEKGSSVCTQLSEMDAFSVMAIRCEIIYKVFGSLSATKLMEFVYETFPELSTMKWGQKIAL